MSIAEIDETLRCMQVTLRVVGRPMRIYPTTASLRRELRDPKTGKARRNKIYAFLLYRKRRGW